MERDWFGNNRHICSVLEDMRNCFKTHNFSGFKGLIEEAQMMANRMEAALADQKDLIGIAERMSEARRELKKVKKELKDAKKELEQIKPQDPAKS